MAPGAPGGVRELSTLTRRELTVALAARQSLLERAALDPAEAIARLTPLQAQHPPAPFIALAARVEGFTRETLERALGARGVVKSTLMRQTLHLSAAADHPAYAQVMRSAWLRGVAGREPSLDLEREAAALREFLREPRDNVAIREWGAQRWPELAALGPWTTVLRARQLLPLVQLPPAGTWNDTRRALFAVDDRPLPPLPEAAALALRRYLGAFGPASLRDAAAWAGVAQRDLRPGLEALDLVRYRSESGTELLDLPDTPLPPAATKPPVRFLAHWDQTLLAYADRDRILPPELREHELTVTGDPVFTVDGRVAGRWAYTSQDGACEITATPLIDLSRSQLAAVRTEAERAGAICAAPGERVVVSVTGSAAAGR